MDQNVLPLTSDVDPSRGSGLPTSLGSPTEDTPHTRQSPTRLSGGVVRKGDTAVDATNDIGYSIEQPPEPKRRLEPKRSKDTIQDALEAKKQRRLQTVDGGSVMEYRRVMRPRKESVYSGLVPPSQSTKKQLAAADEQLLKRPLACNKGRTGSASQDYPITGVSSAAASRTACSDSLTFFSSYKSALQRGAVENPDADLTLTASLGAIVNSRESSAVLVQIVDTLQAFSPLKDNGLCNGSSNGSKNCSGETDYPNVAAAAAAPVKGPPSGGKSASGCSSGPNSRATSIATARPSTKGSGDNTHKMRGVVSFRCKSDSCRNYSSNRRGKAAKGTNNVAKDGGSHQPIRRLSSSRNLPVIWISPPLQRQRQKSGRALLPKGNSRPQSSRAPSAGPPVAQARAHTLLRKTSPSTSRAVEKSDERNTLLLQLHSFRSPFSRESGFTTAQVAEGHRAGGAAGHHRIDAGGNQLPSYGQAAQLPVLETRCSPSNPSRPAAPNAVPRTLDEVLQRHCASLKAQPSTSSVAVLRPPAAAYSLSGGGWAAPPGHLPRLSELSGSALDQHPYYVTGDPQQPVFYPVADASNEYENNGGEGFLPALGHAKPSCVQRAGSLTKRQWAPVPPTGCQVFLELLGPLTAGSISPTPPQQSRQSQQYFQRSPQESTVQYFRKTRRRRMRLAAIAEASARADASSTQPMDPQCQPPRRAKAAMASNQHESMALSDLDEDEGYAAARGYPAVAPSQMGSAAGDDPYITGDQPCKRSTSRKKLEKNLRHLHTFSPYMTGGQAIPGAGRRARAAKPKNKTNGRSEQRRGSGAVRGHVKPIDYAALATERDPLDHLLGRHGFWGEAMTRC
ncbi:hypothetical protein GH5_01534 [Leishmania sp. Ghana 2012 LV757]|uniref:hypothetical protein n=1 Tax=Leishmania sp. Ghana 2012 LV757 TaxID=2803181 RepID=UPI001B520939|nr:hypothetical protein GH5_01534 [Leishmania sp. Ghana 2012 LV757]